MHTALAQRNCAPHSAFVTHAVLQPAPATHAKPLHDAGEPKLHAPNPSQIRAADRSSTHATAPQAAPNACILHLPFPSHMPSKPHVVTSLEAQSSCASVPGAAKSHTPSREPDALRAAEHAKHVPVHA